MKSERAFNMTIAIESSNETSLPIVDNGSTTTMLRNHQYFHSRQRRFIMVKTVIGWKSIGKGIGPASFVLPNGTIIRCKNAIYSPTAPRDIILWNDIISNGYRFISENDSLHLLPERASLTKANIVETFNPLTNKLHSTTIHHELERAEIQNNVVATSDVSLWHDCLGHPGKTIMRSILNGAVQGIPTHIKPNNVDTMAICVPCAKGKLIRASQYSSINTNPTRFLQRIQYDACGPISPASGPFHYYQVGVDSSTRKRKVWLINTKNVMIVRIIQHIIHLRNRYPEYHIETIRVDGAGDYGSDLFAEFCQSLGITLENSAPDEHEMNGLAEAHIKSLQIVARTMLMQSNLPADCWGHAILHPNNLLNLRPLANGTESAAYLEIGHAPNVSHIRKFGCAILHPIPPIKRTKMGPQRAMGIYVGFQSPAIAKYLDPVNRNLLNTKFADCIFLEHSFPSLGGDAGKRERLQAELVFPTKTETHSYPNIFDDPPTNKRHEEIARIINLHRLALGQPDAFEDIPLKMIHPIAMAPARVLTTG